MLKEETSWCEIHIVRIPRFRPVVKHVAGMPRPTIRAVVGGIKVVDTSDDGGCQRRVVHDQLVHPIVQGGRLFRRRQAQVVERLAVERAIIQLHGCGMSC